MPLATPRVAAARRSVAAAVALAAVAAVLGAAPAAPAAAGQPPPPGHVVRDSGGRVRLLVAHGRRVPGLSPAADAVTTARAQLASVGTTFGVRPRDLRAVSASSAAGRHVVRFQQTWQGIPVLAGQLVTVLDGRGGLLSVSGETASVPRGRSSGSFDVAASAAEHTARREVSRRHHVDPRSVRTTRPTRWLLDRSLLDPGASRSLVPVWRVPVRVAGRPDAADLVLVDARTGRVALRLAQVEPLDRVVCDDVRTSSYRCGPGGYDRVEGGPATGVTDADQAYDLTGATSDWYAGVLGVDLTALIGQDLGDGRKLRSTTNYCPPSACPLDNAFWSGDQMVYGAGYTAADDVVAHELAHGVTQHTAGLVYWYQSGAINESMSDVLGELVDQADGVGNDDPSVRWRLGEDLATAAGGAARDMADPPRFGQPDTTTSPLYDLAADYDDNGGVHTNSGVPNKAAYLIADGTAAEPGGAFAGHTFAGIGTARTAPLYWATLQMLTPGSDFADLALALQQSCTNLAYSPGECGTVAAAVDATGLARGLGPGVPRQVWMRGGPGEVQLGWAPPASTGSMPLSSYAVAASPQVHNEDVAVLDPQADSWVLDGLTPGVDYTVRLFAVSTAGTSPAVVARFAGTAVAVRAPASVSWGQRAHVTGRLVDSQGAGRPARRVQLLVRPAGRSGFQVLDTVRTGADGSFGFSWPARRGARWFVAYDGAYREIGVRGVRHRLAVRLRVHVDPLAAPPRPGRLLGLTGTERPVRDGRVRLQRLASAGWVTVATGRLTGGRWTLTWRVPDRRPADLRVWVGGLPAAGLAAGTSAVLHLDPR